MKPELLLSIFSLITVTALGILQWREAARRARSGEALDWSTAANNLRKEIDAQSMEIGNLRAEINGIKKNYKALQELSRRFVKELAKRGDPIILTEEEQSLLYDTGNRLKAAK